MDRKCILMTWKLNAWCCRSDVLGQVMPLVGKDWTQLGVTRLFSAIKVLAVCGKCMTCSIIWDGLSDMEFLGRCYLLLPLWVCNALCWHWVRWTFSLVLLWSAVLTQPKGETPAFLFRLLCDFVWVWLQKLMVWAWCNCTGEWLWGDVLKCSCNFPGVPHPTVLVQFEAGM